MKKWTNFKTRLCKENKREMSSETKSSNGQQTAEDFKSRLIRFSKITNKSIKLFNNAVMTWMKLTKSVFIWRHRHGIKTRRLDVRNSSFLKPKDYPQTLKKTNNTESKNWNLTIKRLSDKNLN